ncbi:MAG: hypothetical protein DRJ42_27895 [Deltaproteobacteria bacterium]|nr:MAG: hypothetical protein DRJ42_27895 [Deltaproteobacteria bacterium]
MSQMPETRQPSAAPVTTRALKILAKSVHRELKSSGYSRGDIVSFTNELLDLVTTDIRDSEPKIS